MPESRSRIDATAELRKLLGRPPIPGTGAIRSLPPYSRQPEHCVAPDCESKAVKRGLCGVHYYRWHRRISSPNSRARRLPHRDGPLCCDLCSRPLADHKLTETCLERR